MSRKPHLMHENLIELKLFLICSSSSSLFGNSSLISYFSLDQSSCVLNLTRLLFSLLRKLRFIHSLNMWVSEFGCNCAILTIESCSSLLFRLSTSSLTLFSWLSEDDDTFCRWITAFLRSLANRGLSSAISTKILGLRRESALHGFELVRCYYLPDLLERDSIPLASGPESLQR